MHAHARTHTCAHTCTPALSYLHCPICTRVPTDTHTGVYGATSPHLPGHMLGHMRAPAHTHTYTGHPVLPAHLGWEGQESQGTLRASRRPDPSLSAFHGFTPHCDSRRQEPSSVPFHRCGGPERLRHLLPSHSRYWAKPACKSKLLTRTLS